MQNNGSLNIDTYFVVGIEYSGLLSMFTKTGNELKLKDA